MDLKSIINTTEAADSSAKRQATPITPVQAGSSQHSFLQYNHPPASGKHPSQDYGSRVPEPYDSPTAYQRVFQGRPSAPTPLQTSSQHDLHSPAAYAAQSPYNRHATSVGGSQYPFPQNTAPQSPAQHQPYPTSLQHRDSFSQSQSLLQQQPQPQNPYGQPSPVPNTTTSGGVNPYFQHQRSSSSHTTSTPTSAHSQQPYYNQHSQDSPVSASSFSHTQLPQHQRQQSQQSQPGTPLGPPISNPRQSFPQPASPYQQRPPSSGLISQPFSNSQGSPPPPHQTHVIRPSESPSHHNSRPVSLTSSSRTQSIRDRSMSVSPKTQLPGLPRVEVVTNQPPPVENGYHATPKRKVDDRESSEPAPQQMSNGAQSSSAVAQQPARKRIRYTEPPIWARSFTGRVKNTNALLGTKRPVNGKQPERPIKSESTNGLHQVPFVATARPPPPVAQVDFRGDKPLGPWEPSIIGVRPYEEVSKIVADWLFNMVVNRPDAGELASRGVEIEIEAKLGQLINKNTNERFSCPVQSECILADNRQVSFRSSMTEAQHKFLNDFLNAKVQETHPGNPHQTKPRVEILYAHRRERDSFYELPPTAHSTLPACIRSELNPRHTVKVRVTHDQKTGQPLAKIIKARVADLDLYNPRFSLDCRISVNLEMKYDGDVESLVASSEANRLPDRNKDRLSYTQSHYQIDLTQVTVVDAGQRIEKEHELEIEVSADAIREQGRRALAQETHQYSELIEGLMDNVRVLTRALPPTLANMA